MDTTPTTPSARNRRLLRVAGIAGTVALTVAVLAACSSSGTASTPAPSASTAQDSAFLTHLKQDGAKVGLIDSPPDSSATNGKLDGLLPSIDAAILKQLGVKKVTPVVSQFAGLVPGLQSGSLDLVSGAFFQTKERCPVLGFGDVEFVYTYSFAVPKGDAKKYTSFADLKKANATLAVENATYQQTQALTVLPQTELLTVDSRQSGIDAVLTGRAAAYAAPTRTLQLLQKQNGDKYDIATIKGIAPLGTSVAFAPANKAFQPEYHAAYEAIEKSGELKKIMDKYGASLAETNKLRSSVYTCS